MTYPLCYGLLLAVAPELEALDGRLQARDLRLLRLADLVDLVVSAATRATTIVL